MTNWKTIEPRIGTRADQDTITMAARLSGEGRARAQLFLTIGSAVAEELGWQAGRVVIQVDPDAARLRLQPTKTQGTARLGMRKDCKLMTVQVPCANPLEPKGAERCDGWLEDGWLMVVTPRWAADALRELPPAPVLRRVVAAAPAASPAPKAAPAPMAAPEPEAPSAAPPAPPAPPAAPVPAQATQPAPAPAPAAPAARRKPPAPQPSPEPKGLAVTASRDLMPAGHSTERARDMRRFWVNDTLPLATVRAYVNSTTPTFPHFSMEGIKEYARILGLPDRTKASAAAATEAQDRGAPPAPKVAGPSPAIPPAPSRHKDRDAVEAEFSAGNRGVRDIAADFGLTVATVSMWLFEWDKAQKKGSVA